MTTVLDRRSLLKAAGSLSLAFSIPLNAEAQAPAPQRPRLPGDLATTPRLDSWLRINADGTVTLMVGKVELGQGILTAVAQVCAEELDIDIGRIRIISGDTALVPNEGVTAGSFSMPNCATAVRHASAEARGILVGLAALKLGQPAQSLSVTDGMVSAPGGASAAFWDLVTGKELAVDAAGQATLKAASAHRYIGRPVPRLDLPAKLSGGDIFLQDLRPAGMLHGRVVRPPAYSATLASLGTKDVEAMPGVVKIVRNGSFLGVVAQTEDQALAAMKALETAARWNVEASMPGHEGIYDWLLATKPARDIPIKAQTRSDATPVARTLEASYRRPYQMHASIGPSAAVATLADGVMTIQTHSQSVFETGAAIAQMLGLADDKVRCQHVQGSGCYGHNMADDAAADAALLAAAVPGQPVRLQYTRAQEHLWEPYGSAMVVKTQASLDKDGNVLDWTLDLWSTPHGTRPGGQAGNLLSARYLEKPFVIPVPQNGGPPNYAADRNAIALYEFPGHKVTTHFITQMPVRVSSTRGLGAYGNVFAIESFIDELALAAGVDPVAYRLRFLKDERARAVLVKAAEAFGWERWQKRPDHGRGIAFARYKNIAAYCAVALEVAVDRATGVVRVLRATAANEAGEIVNPDGIANQIEGGLIQSLSWSLKEEVKFDDTRILSDGWDSYPILTFSETPPVEVVLIDRKGAAFLGTGEASQGPTGATLANAVADAIGVRLRQLPLTPERVKAGLRA
ncbi:xanthine dehydrogenase family protein molybdopterin-binding subunit [Bosea sp. PAMC 26642]|uniref:xanthine dehydrogenase family protein molybdopterin-binding subunit n=1 Tax=Bosea sp. (strain PAMC 26642) TaxID=1792307 RepID=UPI00077048B8|nr:molybdopterin cofactor-binding domain-containing protein [Bosea sp. PAMC 26642]AMJ62980.1 aldehyde dehydrogenase [Bosea sp. PAMC 26642]